MARCVRMNTKHERIIDSADRQKDVNITAKMWSDAQPKCEISATDSFSLYFFVFNRFQPSGDRI